MSSEYYGAPKEAGAYIATATSSSQDDDISYSDSSIRNYFSSYQSESTYPDFMINYGDALETSSNGPSKPVAGAFFFGVPILAFCLFSTPLSPDFCMCTYLSLQFSLLGADLSHALANRRRILSDLDVETLKTLLGLVREDSVCASSEKGAETLEGAIFDELETRTGESSTLGASSSVIDWNGHFQKLLDSPDSIDKFGQLRNLANDFCFTAELYARVIISELYLPTCQKTIKPSSVGGVAGGQKFVVQGILFKFAVDVELKKSASTPSSTTPTPASPASEHTKPKNAAGNGSVWMYGGSGPATEYAMKAAKHELRSTIAYFSTNACRVPLVAIVDFRGYRVLCSSVLPIDQTTICYGSSDAGKTVHSDKEAAELFEMAGKKLNLKKHLFKGHELCAPVDVEGHHGHDGRMYCIDLARLFPPEAPTLALQAHSRAMFFRMLRPELVRLLPHPLSSDAFTSFGAEQYAEHNAEVEYATRHLQTILVPNFAKSLYAMDSVVNSFSSLVYQTHRNGINLRYLGLIRSHIRVPEAAKPTRRIYIPSISSNDYLSLTRSNEGSEHGESMERMEERVSRADEMMSTLTESEIPSSDPLRVARSSPALSHPHAAEEAIRQLILEEMIARTLKGMLRAQWRKRMQEVRICTETPFASVFLELLNIVGGKSTHSKHFWNVLIKEELVAKFAVGLSPQEMDASFDLMECVELRSLLERFVSLVGVNITLRNDVLNTAKRPFLYTDIGSITSTIHHMNIIDFAEGRLLALTARKRDRTLKLQLLSMAEKKLTSAHSSGTNVSLSVVFELANVHYEKSMLLTLQDCTSNVIEAVRCYRAALQLATGTQSASIVAKCHIRLLRLFFERLGPNILLQESALQAQGIGEMTIAAHMDGAATHRPRALRKLISKIAKLPEPEPAVMLLSTYLPDCSRISTFGTLLTCLTHASNETKAIAKEIFSEEVTMLNFQFSPQLLGPLTSGWMIGTSSGIWNWNSLTSVDFTACLTLTCATLKMLLTRCARLTSLVINQCESIGDEFADVLTSIARSSADSKAIESTSAQNTVSSNSLLSTMDELKMNSESSSFSEAISSSIASNIADSISAGTPGSATKKGASSLSIPTPSSSPTSHQRSRSSSTTSSKSPRPHHITQSPIALERLEMAFCPITDRFFEKLDKSDSPTLSKLKYLNLRSCVELTDASLKVLAMRCHSMSALLLDSCPKIVELKYLRKMKLLTQIGLHNSRVPEPKLREMIRKFFHQLVYLDVSMTGVLDSSFDLLDSEEVVYNDLVFLNLRKTKVTKATLAKLSRSAPNLTTLVISSTEMGHGFGKFVTFAHLTRLESSLNKWTSGCDVSLVTLKGVSAPVTHLGLRSCWNTITDPVLLMSVRSFPNLTSLNISVCTSLSNASMEAVSNLLQLRFLSLSGNRQLVDSALIRIARSLGANLTGLEIAHCKQISTAGLEALSKHCTNLQYIDISFIESFRRIHSLGTYCLRLESVKAVGLAGCASDSFQRLFNRGISLRRVNFKSCPISNDAVIACAYSSRFLQEICLSDCAAVDDVGISRLFQLCRYIHKLELTSVSVTDASFDSGKASICLLKYLIVSGCRKLTDKTITILANNCKLLEFLNCSGCPLLTDAPILKLVEAVAPLKSLSIAFCPRVQQESIEEAMSLKGGHVVK